MMMSHSDVIVMFGKKGFGQAQWAARQAIQRQATLVQGDTTASPG